MTENTSEYRVQDLSESKIEPEAAENLAPAAEAVEPAESAIQAEQAATETSADQIDQMSQTESEAEEMLGQAEPVGAAPSEEESELKAGTDLIDSTDSDAIQPSALLSDKPVIRPLELTDRLALYVYCSNYKGSRQLERYGEVSYTSQKSHFTLLYINAADRDEIIAKLKELRFVRRVVVSHMPELNQDFSAAFAQTNQEIKEEMGL